MHSGNAKSFTKAVLEAREADDAQDEPRSGAVHERPTEQAFALSLRSKDGRFVQGFPWFRFDGFDFHNDGREEQLDMVFGERVVEIRGFYLSRLVDRMAEGQLKIVQQHDVKEIEDLRRENADLPRGQHKPMILSIDVTPPLSKTVSEIREDSDDERRRAVVEGRGR
jgi:hypothetical protein